MFNVRVEGENGTLLLTDKLDNGGGGTIYHHPSRVDLLVKTLKNLTDDKRRKLEALFQSPPVLASGLAHIARPLKRVFSVSSGELVGFTMSKVYGHLLADIVNPCDRPLSFQNYTKRLQFVGTLAKSVEELSLQDYILFDGLAGQNIIAGPELWFLDVDGWQFSANGTVHHAEAVHEELLPPELTEGEIGTVALTEHQDAWCLATMIIWCLTSHHPFDVKLKSSLGPSLEDRIAEGLWPHSRRARRRGVGPHPAAPLELLHPAMRRLAIQCFDVGCKDATKRPLPAEWHAAIEQALADKAFLDQVPKIEADAVRKQMAAYKPTPAGRWQRAAGHTDRHGQKRHPVKATVAIVATVIITVAGMTYHTVVDQNSLVDRGGLRGRTSGHSNILEEVASSLPGRFRRCPVLSTGHLGFGYVHPNDLDAASVPPSF